MGVSCKNSQALKDFFKHVNWGIGNIEYFEKDKQHDLNLYIMVGATGFEPATTSSQNWCATGLRYDQKDAHIVERFSLFDKFSIAEAGLFDWFGID